MMEAMRSAEPGMYEYEIEAIGDYIFKVHNAQGVAYFALVAAGQEQPLPALPLRADADEGRRPGPVRLRARLQVLRIRRHARVPGQWQVHRRISASCTAIYVKLYKALMTSIKPNVPMREILTEVVAQDGRGDGGAHIQRTRSTRKRPTRFVETTAADPPALPPGRRRAAAAASATRSAWRSTT